MRYRLLSLAVPLAVAVAALWVGPPSQQQTPDTGSAPAKSQKKPIDVDNFPVVEFSLPEPTDSKRKARAEKHNKSHWEVNPNVTADTTVSVDRIDLNLPALPIEKAAAIVVGTVSHAHAYLSNDKTGVYSSFVISMEEVLKNPDDLTVGASIEVEREGGRVKFPSGRVHLYMISEQAMPRTGGRYVLFLAGTDTPSVFEIITGYEIRDNSIYALDDLPQHRSRENVPADNLLNDLKTKLMNR